jgi:hypothetical protein
MKIKLAFASVLVLSGCGPSREAMSALQDMQILENNEEASISYKSLSGWGNDLTLHDVEVRAPAEMLAAMTESAPDKDDTTPSVPPASKPATVARAKSMTLRGLTQKEGKPFATDITLSEITPTVPMEGATLSLKSVGFEGMNDVTGRYVAGSFTKDGAGDPPPLEQWGFRKAGLGGLTFSAAIPQDEGDPGSVNLALAELSVSSLDNTRLGLFRFDGFKGDLNVPGDVPVAGTFDFGRLDLTGIRTKLFSDAFMVGLQPLLNPGEPADIAALYKDYTSPLESGIDGVDWSGLKVDFSGLKFDVSPARAIIKRNADDVVTAIDAPRTTFKFTADSSGGTLGAMGLMVLAMGGYNSSVVELYTESHATFDPAKDLTRYDNINLGISDAFDVKVSGGVIGLKQALPNLMAGLMKAAESAEASFGDDDMDMDDEDSEDEDWDADEDAPPVALPPGDDAAEEDDSDHAHHADGDEHADHEGHGDHHDMPMEKPDNSAAMMQLVMGVLPLQLTDLDVSITDQKLINLIVEPQALSSGQTVEAYRQQLVDMVTASSVFLTDAGVDQAIATELTTAVSGFLAGPGTFHIVLKPKAPLGVMSAMMTPMTKENLGFSATFTAATPPAPAIN